MIGIMGIKDGFMISKGLVTSLLSKKAPVVPPPHSPLPLLNTCFLGIITKFFIKSKGQTKSPWELSFQILCQNINFSHVLWI